MDDGGKREEDMEEAEHQVQICSWATKEGKKGQVKLILKRQVV